MIKNYLINFLKFVIAFVCITLSTVKCSAEEASVLEFYRERASAVYESRNPLERGLTFSFKSKTYYKKISSRGNIVSTDSSISKSYYSFGNLDSLVFDTVYSKKEINFEFKYPNVFSYNYIFNFFPNDTGDVNLAIGFDTDSINNTHPVGIAVIDRKQYFMKWLYLHFPQVKHQKRLSRSFRFTDYEGYVFPDSVWDVGLKGTLLSDEHYRVETKISEIKIKR